MNYKEVTTQKEYKNLLNELSVESKNFADKYPQVSIYKSIYNQINDIKNAISNNIRLSENEIYERYSIGAIAIKNFDCDQEIFGRKLQDVFGGLFEYWDMPEK
ncbi:immunity protein Tsi6 family protein [Chryseobacterium taichungense]|uniref:immunity protein Tsi6 family protein n=1 Tax=Chryseobacterium taichungense TaxID=295069 RepID=UPI0028AA0DC2|nr:immunity protein Tsi6 family protein [Chryseobacterium taichungense]